MIKRLSLALLALIVLLAGALAVNTLRQGSRQVHPLTLAAGEGKRRVVAQVVDVQLVQQIVQALFNLPRR